MKTYLYDSILSNKHKKLNINTWQHFPKKLSHNALQNQATENLCHVSITSGVRIQSREDDTTFDSLPSVGLKSKKDTSAVVVSIISLYRHITAHYRWKHKNNIYTGVCQGSNFRRSFWWRSPSWTWKIQLPRDNGTPTQPFICLSCCSLCKTWYELVELGPNIMVSRSRDSITAFLSLFRLLSFNPPFTHVASGL